MRVQFTPHLMPMVRGILSTVYATLRDPNLVRDDLIQKRINETLSLWRDFHSHSISRRKQEYLRKQKKYHAKEQCQANNLKRRSRKDLLLYDGLNDKIFIDIDHLTPCSNFLHIFEMTSSLFLCILGDILLSEQDDNWEKNRQRYQDEDEDDDGIYNIASLYQEEEEGIRFSRFYVVVESVGGASMRLLKSS